MTEKKQSNYRTTEDKINLAGIRVNLAGKKAVIDAIDRFISEKHHAIIASGNVHSFNIAHRYPWYKDFLQQADIVRLDGAGLRLGAWILGYRTPPRSTWADFGWELAEFCAKRGYRLFFFGAKPGVAELAAKKLKEQLPALQVAGTHHGHIDLNPTSMDCKGVIEMINAAHPDILIVGLGMPEQERWLTENRTNLKVAIVMTGGAVFDYLSGQARRAPRWMTDHGLEWLGRMLLEPTRLWKRYIIGNPIFFVRVLKQRFFGFKRA